MGNKNPPRKAGKREKNAVKAGDGSSTYDKIDAKNRKIQRQIQRDAEKGISRPIALDQSDEAGAQLTFAELAPLRREQAERERQEQVKRDQDEVKKIRTDLTKWKKQRKLSKAAGWDDDPQPSANERVVRKRLAELEAKLAAQPAAAASSDNQEPATKHVKPSKLKRQKRREEERQQKEQAAAAEAAKVREKMKKSVWDGLYD